MKTKDKRYIITESQLRQLEVMAGMRPDGPALCTPLDELQIRIRNIVHAYNRRNGQLDLHHHSRQYGVFCKKCRAVFAKWFDASQVTEKRWTSDEELRRILSHHYGVSKKRIDWIIEMRRKKRASRERAAQEV